MQQQQAVPSSSSCTDLSHAVPQGRNALHIAAVPGTAQLHAILSPAQALSPVGARLACFACCSRGSCAQLPLMQVLTHAWCKIVDVVIAQV